MKTLIALICWLCLLLPVSASPNAVVVVLLPGTSLSEWQDADAPALHRLLQTGAASVMNTRTAHRAGKTETETPQAALLTLAAGSRAAGTVSATGFVPAFGASAAFFERRTGQKPSPGASVCLEWPAVAAANRDLGYDLRLGSLADTLAVHKILVAAGGGPSSDWLAADSFGTVQRVSRLTATPGECLIWDAGPDIQAADAAIADAAGQIAAIHGRLVIVSPTVSGQSRSLAPVLVWGPGIPAGLLASPSTRCPGLTTNTDFAPTIAAYFGIPRSGFQPLPFGFAWSEMPLPDGVKRAEALNTEAIAQSDAMRLLPYLAAVLGFWILAVTVLASRFAVPGVLCLAPAAALTAALFAVSALSFGILVLVMLAVLAAVTRIVRPERVLIFGCAAISAAVGVDMVTGNSLMHRGILGYSALEGARYYGLGNEAMGLLLGAALGMVYGFWQPRRSSRFGLTALMVGIIILLGSAGAKAGGVLASLAIFGTFLHTVSGRRWTLKSFVLLAAAVLTGMAAAALGDAFLHPGSRSHLGEAVQRIASGGVGEGWDIVRRKLAVEGRLAYHSAWAALLWLALGSTIRLWKGNPAAHASERALRSAGAIGALACLLLNDAGVVAGAIFAAFVWSLAITQKSLPVLDSSRAGRPII